MTYKPLCSCQTSYPLSDEDRPVEKANAVLRNAFGHSSFRPGQLEAIVGALHGRDVFARMATGAGKSLPMFAVPLSYAVGVVISPLKSLMDEQVCAFRNGSCGYGPVQHRSLLERCSRT